MKKTFAILAIGLVLVVIRFVAIAGRTFRGQQASSPDKQFVAYGGVGGEKLFWGGEKSYYQFTVARSNVSPTVPSAIVQTPEVRMEVIFDVGIKWASNSSDVTFVFDGRRLTLEAPK